MDFNKVKIISWSNMVNEKGEQLNLMEQVAFCARVSNPTNQYNTETSEKLCKYLIKNHHWSPFEMANICIEIETTRDISRQILRHRSFSFQEFSQRYALVNDFVTRECRLQHPTNRQKSNESTDIVLNDEFVKIQNELIQKEIEYYNFCIKNNIAKEQSRVILSEGLTKTRLYMNGTIRSWIHYLQIRTTEDTQKEHRDLAIKIRNEIRNIFPLDIF